MQGKWNLSIQVLSVSFLFKLILALWQLPFPVLLLFQISLFPPRVVQSSVFTLWLSLLSANPRPQTLPHKLFFLSSPWTVLTDSHLTKTQWKKTTPHFDSCVYRKLLQLLLQKAWGEAEGTCGSLDLHIVHQDASAPHHTHRDKSIEEFEVLIVLI